ncbi:hypothetical protein AVEN_131555-1 [Araneus ventricosus]|uniref:Uncharacterized protein n=1 Tax=Araneus ventricosus TaxID=182803 RepID=A0A4Y2WJH3_ARAVE|nr:hypothetical protein AVEN_131555-1 [Araneus ventricosus]
MILQTFQNVSGSSSTAEREQFAPANRRFILFKKPQWNLHLKISIILHIICIVHKINHNENDPRLNDTPDFPECIRFLLRCRTRTICIEPTHPERRESASPLIFISDC